MTENTTNAGGHITDEKNQTIYDNAVVLSNGETAKSLESQRLEKLAQYRQHITDSHHGTIPVGCQTCENFRTDIQTLVAAKKIVRVDTN